MKYVVMEGVAKFGTDMVLKLSKEQAASRAHNLEEVEKGRYRPKMIVEFKRGEEIELAVDYDDLPRNLAVVLAPADKVTRKKKGGETPIPPEAPVPPAA